MPILPGDSPGLATEQIKRIREPRLKGMWDPRREVGLAYKQALGLPQPVAWDVYMAYAPEVKWTGDYPPPPAFWLSQHELADEVHFMTSTKLEMATGALLHETGVR